MQTAGNNCLSEGAEELAALLETGDDAPAGGRAFDCDVLIVGSGYGGAVAAARLAGAQRAAGEAATVWLLERGSEHLPGSFPTQLAELPGHIRFALQDGNAPHGEELGLFDVRIGADVSALLANGLGGGSLINAGVMCQPPASVFAAGWPAGIDLASLEPAYLKAEEMLSARRSPRDLAVPKLVNLNGLGSRATAARACLTVHFKTQPAALGGCTLCGDCMTGCNQGAKMSLDSTYLHEAAQAGVRMFCGGAVEWLQQDAGGWIVHWHFTRRSLRPADGRPMRLRARRVILAAGTLGSTEILMRSREHGLALSTELGRRFSSNGDQIAASIGRQGRAHACADPQTDPADLAARGVGPTILGLRQVPKTFTPEFPTLPGYVLEDLAVPGALRAVFGELVFLLARFLAPAPDDPQGADESPFAAPITDADIDRISLYAFIGPDAAAGRLSLPARPRRPAVEGGLKIDWPELADSKLPGKLGDWLRGVSPSGTTVVMTSGFNIGARNLVHASLTVHPLGGCAMGDSVTQAVVDGAGAVFDPAGGLYEGLAVLDGSIVPTALGINPALTITALAEHAMPTLLQRWQLGGAATAAAAPMLRLPAAPRRLPPPRSDWLLHECLRGLISFDQDRSFFWAVLEIEFETIPGLNRAVQQPNATLKMRVATLSLYHATRGDDEFSIEPDENRLACRADLSGQMRFFAQGQPGDIERMTELVYQLSVQSLRQGSGPLQIGGRFEGIKRLGKPAGAASAPNPLRQLSEMELHYERNRLGLLAIDLDFLARQRDPLFALLRASNLVDAFADLASGAALVVRRLALSWLEMVANLRQPPDATQAHHLDERYPAAIKGLGAPRIIELDGKGTRLTNYALPESAHPPILLIHGLGVSGSSFTHRSIPRSLARCLHDLHRDVWILDLSSSIANEWGRQNLPASHWSVYEIAQTEIAGAIDRVLAETQQPQLDVFAHCMGGLMFCMATLNDLSLAPKIHAAILSQTGPLPRLSPYNRFRAYVVGMLEQLFDLDEIDSCPDYQATLGPGGRPVWRHAGERSAKLELADALLALFPYPERAEDSQSEASRECRPPVSGSDFIRIRHRADGIFGQLFELPKLHDETLAHLDALFGWIKVRLLLQAIQFTRYQLLTDREGKNSFVHESNLAEGFGFPVLFIHGQRNRVFDWRGGLDSLRMLQQLRGERVSTLAEPSHENTTLRRYGQGATQLTVFKDYGHLDCILGRDIETDIVPELRDFLDAPLPRPGRAAQPVAPLAQVPALGPMLGWLRREDEAGERRIRLHLLVHPAAKASRTYALALMPVREGLPLLAAARLLPWPGGYGQVLSLSLRDAADRADRYALLTLHADRPPALAAPDAAAWLAQSSAVDAASELALREALFVKGQDLAPEARQSFFAITPQALAAADRGEPATQPAALRFALASCQYPPTLVDETAAGASYARLAREAERPDGPQLLLLAGDQIYLDASAGLFAQLSSPSAIVPKDSAVIARSYELTYGLPGMRRTVSRLPTYAMLDDHEVGNDWPGLAAAPTLPEVSVPDALQAFRHFQRALGPFGKPSRLGGIGSESYVFHPAGHAVFMLDTRIGREPRTARTVEQACMLSADVMAALLRGLSEAPAEAVKFVLTPSPLLPPERFVEGRSAERLHSDSGSGYPAWRAQLLNFIREREIRRVVLLSGDSHLSSVSEFAFEAPHDRHRVIGIVSSGLYAPWPFANQRPDELLRGGPCNLGTPAAPCLGTLRLHAMSAANGYAIVSVDPDGGWLSVRLQSADGGSSESVLAL